MNSVEIEARTVDEAIEQALNELDIPREDADIEVLEKGSKGLFGVGSKPARVRVSKLSSATEPETVLREILDRMNLTTKVSREEKEDGIYLDVECTDPAILIGRKGQNLSSVQYLVNRIYSKEDRTQKRVYIDVEGYRSRHLKKLGDLAHQMAEKAIERGRPIRLEPMSPQDRWAIHVSLKDHDKVRTFSRGTGTFRNVVIAPKDASNDEPFRENQD